MNIYRPAGNRVVLEEENFDPTLLTELPLRLYQSGTAALAAALLGCRQLVSGRDEVIVPGYACPDLLSAVIHAGARPVLVDIEPNGHGYDLQRLEQRIDDRTLAVISVRFLGLTEDIDALKRLCRSSGARLVLDSAQWFPCAASDGDWPADCHILSFGRGKPVNLLHGGAVISRDERLHQALPIGRSTPADGQPAWRHRVKLRAYNLAINPWVYGLVSRLPGLHVGETVYHPLEALEGMSRYHQRLLTANIRKYRQSHRVARHYRRMLTSLPAGNWQDLTGNSEADALPPLLRYPLLIEDAAARERILASGNRLGLSALYRKPLPKIPGVRSLLDAVPDLPNASRLAARLVTLPTHEDITEEQAVEIVALIGNFL